MGAYQIPEMITRLNQVEEEIRKIKGMIENDAYCDDILSQISATKYELNAIGKLLLAKHIKSCVVHRIQDGDFEIIQEFPNTIQKLMK